MEHGNIVLDVEQGWKENKMDVISRQDAMDLVKHRMEHNPMKSVEFIQGLQDAYLRVINDLNALPSVQRKGKWIGVEDESYNIVGHYCSNCDLPMETEEPTNYCPNCGADMRGEEDEIN